MSTKMLRWPLLIAAALLFGCEDQEGLDPTGTGTTGTSTTSATETTTETETETETDTTTSTGTIDPKAACVDRPTDLMRPPSGQLPCELLPPGF